MVIAVSDIQFLNIKGLNPSWWISCTSLVLSLLVIALFEKKKGKLASLAICIVTLPKSCGTLTFLSKLLWGLFLDFMYS